MQVGHAHEIGPGGIVSIIVRLRCLRGDYDYLTRRALVLAGGGFAASAWEIGLVAGMAEAGVDVRNADLFIGTSSGARVALHLVSGVALNEIFQRQLGPSPRPGAPPPAIDWMQFREGIARAKQVGGTPADVLRRIGSLMLAAPETDAPNRRQIAKTQLPIESWPEQRLLMVAVNAETGERRAFDRDSGIDLVDAVLATSAFGGPPVLFEGHHYLDGGFYSTDNADLAAGFDRVLILALRSPPASLAAVPLETALETLRRGGAQVEVVHPDEDTQAAFASAGSLMNPAICEPAARAGHAQGQRLAGAHASSIW